MMRRNAWKIDRLTSEKQIFFFLVAIFTMLGLTSDRVMANDVFMESNLPVQGNFFIPNQAASFVIQPTLTPNPGSLCSTAWMDISSYNSSYDAYLTLNTNSVLKSTNSATWTPNIPEAGLYRVEAFVANHPSLYWSCINQTISADTRDARYVIKHANGENRVSRDQLPLTNQWLDLGSYYFNAGQGGKVTLSDLNGEANATHFVSFSAMKFTLVEEDNEVMPVYTPSRGSLCTTGWLDISGYNSFYDAYVTLNTNDISKSSNYGIWTPNLSQTGLYKVEAFVANHPSLYWSCLGRYISPDTTDARYEITYAGGQTTKSRNQLPLVNQWLDLGNYNFNAGTSGRVKLSDYNGEAHASHFISFSAMRFSLLDTSGCVVPSSLSSSLATSSISALNDDSCDVLPEAKLIYPYEDEDREPDDYPKYGPGDTIHIEAQASDPLGQGIKRVEFWVQYGGDWVKIKDEKNAPYEADFTIPYLLMPHIIEIRIKVVSTDDRIVVDPGGKRYASYKWKYGSDTIANWIPAGQRAYLNQHSMCPTATDGCTVTGGQMCGSAAVSMALAMNYVTYSDYTSLVDTAKIFSAAAPKNDITVIEAYINNKNNNIAATADWKRLLENVTGEDNDAWDVIKKEIDQGYPVLVLSDRWRDADRKGHYIVVVGYQYKIDADNNETAKAMIVYDSGGEWKKKYENGGWTWYVDKNTTDPNSHIGQWVLYDYSDVWGYNSNTSGLLMTIHPTNSSNALNANNSLSASSVSVPDIISDEPENLHIFDGIDIDYEAPNVQSIHRNGAEITNADSVAFTVTFSELVVDVDQADFSLSTSGIIDATILNVSGSDDTYTVTVDTGSGNGTIRLDVVDDDSIVDGMANPLGEEGIGNGDYSNGEEYEIVKTSTCTFSGTIDLQGRSDDTGATFTAVGSSVGTFSTTTDASGYYELTVPEDTYDIAAEMDRYLNGERTGEVCPVGGVNQPPQVTLLGGDANEDCVINILDLAFMGARFGLSDGDPDFDARADINDDGTINILDLTVAGANFMETCPVVW